MGNGGWGRGLVLCAPSNGLTMALAPKLSIFSEEKFGGLGPIISKPQDIDVQEGR